MTIIKVTGVTHVEGNHAALVIWTTCGKALAREDVPWRDRRSGSDQAMLQRVDCMACLVAMAGP